MTNRSAILLFLFLAIAAGIDGYFGWHGSVLIGQKLLVLVDLLAVWR